VDVHVPQGHLSRRQFLGTSALSLGPAALVTLLEQAAARGQPRSLGPLPPLPPQVPARAQSVIFLFMIGGPSQLDLFDPKPELIRRDGEPLPTSLL